MARIRTIAFLLSVLFFLLPLLTACISTSTVLNRDPFTQGRPRLAILPFTGGNPEEAESIAEFFSQEYDINRVFAPVPRTSAIETLMKEQQFQRSGLTDSDTIAELGRQLNADYVLAGHIAVLGGSTKLLLITIIDVQELQQIAGDYREYQQLGSAVDDILPDMAKRIAEVTGRRAGSRKRPKLAVLPFNVLSSGMDEGDAELLAQLLATELANSGAYAVFPRTGAIERVMEEHHIERSGMTDPESIRVIGAAVNAQYVLSANVRNIEGENYFSALILNIVEASQGPGTHEKYRTVNDGLTLMPKIARTLIGVSTPVGNVPTAGSTNINKKDSALSNLSPKSVSGYSFLNLALGLGSFIQGDTTGGVITLVSYGATAGLIGWEMALSYNDDLAGIPGTVGLGVAGFAVVYGFIRPILYNRDHTLVAIADRTNITLVRGTRDEPTLRLSYILRF